MQPYPTASIETVRSWARERLASGAEPPFSYYRFMQLLDAIEHLEKLHGTPSELHPGRDRSDEIEVSPLP